LAVYDDQVREAVGRLLGRIEGSRALRIWDEAGATRWQKAPVWIHGDISAGNLLVRDGQLVAVIDFGQLATGDPACDLAIGWTLLSGASRDTFRSTVGLDLDTWKRGQAWALWKALITASGLSPTTAIESGQAERTLDQVLRG
jgi:aminoglycoside phosphotransferase (APT) family kinase protein